MRRFLFLLLTFFLIKNGPFRLIFLLFLFIHDATCAYMQADPLDCALDLMRRLPPQKVEQNLSGLLELCPDLTEDLLSAVDQPLKVQNCKASGKEYLLCDYNRDGDSYRYA